LRAKTTFAALYHESNTSMAEVQKIGTVTFRALTNEAAVDGLFPARVQSVVRGRKSWRPATPESAEQKFSTPHRQL